MTEEPSSMDREKELGARLAGEEAGIGLCSAAGSNWQYLVCTDMDSTDGLWTLASDDRSRPSP